jgi:nucleoid-associated protein YgaU
MFDASSRYATIATETLTERDGTVVAYMKRRFIPQGSAMLAIQSVKVVAGDRLDNVSAKTLGNPLQFWRICDANDAMYPPDLTYYPGTVLAIPVPGR